MYMHALHRVPVCDTNINPINILLCSNRILSQRILCARVHAAHKFNSKNKPEFVLVYRALAVNVVLVEELGHDFYSLLM